jgi:uncharacterized protein (TIGR02246 family)
MEKLRKYIQSRTETRPWIALVMAAAFLVALSVVTLSAQVARAEGQLGDGEAVARAWVDALNRGDAEGALALYADDAVIEALGKEIEGKQAIAQRQQGTITQVLHPSLQIVDVETRGDEVVLRLKGENAITRFDGHGAIENQVTFTIQDGRIQREVGPILSQADMAWYREAQVRFQQSGGRPSQLPHAGESGEPASYGWALGLSALGLSAVSMGLILRWRRPRQLREVPMDDDR